MIAILLLSAACTNRAKESVKITEDEKVAQVITSGEPATDSTEFADDAEITFRSPEFNYGEPDFCYDQMLTLIDETEYKEVVSNYNNIRIDTTRKIEATNGVFSIPLENGTTKELVNKIDTESDATVEYTYVGHIPTLGYYEFICSLYAGSNICWISQKSGEKFSFNNSPLFSPNRKLCAVIDTEEEGVYKDGIIEVYQVEKNNITYLFMLWSEDILPDQACWHHNTTLYIKAHLNNKNEVETEVTDFQYYKINFSKIK